MNIKYIYTQKILLTNNIIHEKDRLLSRIHFVYYNDNNNVNSPRRHFSELKVEKLMRSSFNL